MAHAYSRSRKHRTLQVVLTAAVLVTAARAQTPVKETAITPDERDTIAGFFATDSWWGFTGVREAADGIGARETPTLYTEKGRYEGLSGDIEILPGTGAPVFETAEPAPDSPGSAVPGGSRIRSVWVDEAKVFEAADAERIFRSPGADAFAFSARPAIAGPKESPLPPAAEGVRYVTYLGKRYGPFGRIGTRVAFSPNGKTFLFSGFAEDGESGGWRFFDGTELTGPYDSEAAPVFSPDGESWYCALSRDGKITVRTPGRASEPLDFLSGFAFGTGGRFAYTGRLADGYYAITESGKTGPYAECTAAAFHPDGETFAYGYKAAGGWYVSSGKSVAGPYDLVSAPLYLKDGALVYAWVKNGAAWVQSGKSKAGPYASVDGLRADPDGTAPLYEASSGGKRYVIHGTGKFGPYDELLDTRGFDGNAYCYAARIGSNRFFCIEGRNEGMYDDVTLVDTHRNEGGPFLYLTKKDGVTVLHAGEMDIEYADDTENIGYFDFSADETEYVFCETTKDGKSSVVFGDRRLGPFGYAGGSRISPDGKIIGFSFMTPRDMEQGTDRLRDVLHIDGRTFPGKFVVDAKNRITGYVLYRNGAVQRYGY